MNEVLLSPIKLEELKAAIREVVQHELGKLNKREEELETVYFTRQELAAYLNISLPTLHDWTRKGIIKGYRIGTRIRYKKKDVQAALKEIKGRNR